MLSFDHGKSPVHTDHVALRHQSFQAAENASQSATSAGFFSSLAVDCAAGAVGGVAICAVGHPFDTIKLRMQTGMFDSAWEGVKQTLQREGVRRGLYAGVESPLVLGVLFRSWLVTCLGVTNWQLENYGVMTRGAVAGLFATLIESPMLLLMNQVQARPNTTVLGRASALYRCRGLLGGFQGMGACAVRNVPSNALYFTTYEHCRHHRVHPFIAGGLAGIAYCAFTYPLDTVRGCLHADSPDPSKRTYLGYGHCMRTLFANGGLPRLFQGYRLALYRAFPANGTFFLTVDTMRRWLTDPKRTCSHDTSAVLGFEGGDAAECGAAAVGVQCDDADDRRVVLSPSLAPSSWMMWSA